MGQSTVLVGSFADAASNLDSLSSVAGTTVEARKYYLDEEKIKRVAILDSSDFQSFKSQN